MFSSAPPPTAAVTLLSTAADALLPAPRGLKQVSPVVAVCPPTGPPQPSGLSSGSRDPPQDACVAAHFHEGRCTPSVRMPSSHRRTGRLDAASREQSDRSLPSTPPPLSTLCSPSPPLTLCRLASHLPPSPPSSLPRRAPSITHCVVIVVTAVATLRDRLLRYPRRLRSLRHAPCRGGGDAATSLSPGPRGPLSEKWAAGREVSSILFLLRVRPLSQKAGFFSGRWFILCCGIPTRERTTSDPAIDDGQLAGGEAKYSLRVPSHPPSWPRSAVRPKLVPPRTARSSSTSTWYHTSQ